MDYTQRIIERLRKKTRVRKGTCFWDNNTTSKDRPAVVLKRLENIVIYTVLTTSDNIHKSIPVNDKNFNNNYYTYGLYITHVSQVEKHHMNRTVNPKSINSIVKELTNFFVSNLT